MKQFLLFALPLLTVNFLFGQTIVINCNGISDVDADANIQGDGSTDPNHPYVSWEAAINRAIQNNQTNQTINFSAGTYNIGSTVIIPGDNGDCSSCTGGGGPDYTNVDLSGLTVNGNGALIVNPSGQVQVRFAQIDADNVTFNDLSFQDFNATGGAVLQIYDVTGVTFNNCVFDGCDLGGDAIEIGANRGASSYTYQESNTEVTFEGCQFSNNNGNGPSSAVSVFHNAVDPLITLTVRFNNSTTSCNSRQGFGGAIKAGHRFGGSRPSSAPGPRVILNGGSFSGNISSSNGAMGGAILVQNNSTLEIDGTQFIGNKITNATSGAHGGAIAILSGSKARIQNALFHRNTSTVYGGAVYNSSSELVEFINCEFVADTARRGGAVYLDNETYTIFDRCTIANNHGTSAGTADGGAGIYQRAGDGSSRTKTYLKVSNSDIILNTCPTSSARPYAGLHVHGSENSSATTPSTRDSIIIENSNFCGSTNLGGNADYSIFEDLVNIFDSADPSTIFLGTNSLSRGKAYGDHLDTYSFSGCPRALSSPAPIPVPSCIPRPADPPCTTLPIELMAFTAEPINSNSLLKWSTASESHSDYFQVLRSTDALNWTELGKVNAAGFSTETQHYQFVDQQPLAGANYYKLIQYDFDGSMTNSDIVVLKHAIKNNVIFYPNPADNSLHIEQSANISAPLSIEIFDFLGRKVFEGEIQNSKHTINLSHLNEGQYSIRFQSSNIEWVERLLIKH